MMERFTELGIIPAREAINRCVTTEAEALEESILFVAVHRPMNLRRISIEDGRRAQDETNATENDLLKSFLIDATNLPTGTLVLRPS